MNRRVVFPNKLLPYILVAPQIAITLVFFFWPAFQAVRHPFIATIPSGSAAASSASTTSDWSCPTPTTSIRSR